MFSEIYRYRMPVAWQSFSIMLCASVVTIATIVFPNLQHVFGSYNENTDFMQRLTIAFQHGFEAKSAVVHLLVDIVLLALVGTYVEKIMGSYLFFLLNLVAIAQYIFIHALLGMTGHGGSGLIWAYAPMLFYSLNEGRLLKTRSQFDEMYFTFRTVLVIMYTIIPLLMSIIPIYFDSESPMLQAVFFGNIFHLSATLTGIGFVVIYREKVRTRMKQFAKKKKFEEDKYDKMSFYFALFYPVLIIIGFFFTR